MDSQQPSRLVYRQKLATRITHWIWAICFFFLLMSGLQIFNAHPTLYLGKQSGFAFNNSVLDIGTAENSDTTGRTMVLGRNFTTTGVLGVSSEDGEATDRGFPSWSTIPNTTDLATGRVVHFFFAWLLVGTLFVWLIFSVFNRHLTRDIAPTPSDIRQLPADIVGHLKLKFDHGNKYNPLQKLTYALVLLVLFPLMIATGLSMSPGMNAFAPWMLDLFGGRQTARTIHFVAMLSLVGFVIVHVVMVVAAGPINELRSMITGWYRTRFAEPAEQQTMPEK